MIYVTKTLDLPPIDGTVINVDRSKKSKKFPVVQEAVPVVQEAVPVVQEVTEVQAVPAVKIEMQDNVIDSVETTPEQRMKEEQKGVTLINGGYLTRQEIQNLTFTQDLKYYSRKFGRCRRLDFINELWKEGTCIVGKFVDKMGKGHFVVNTQLCGEAAWKYAMHLLMGGVVMNF